MHNHYTKDYASIEVAHTRVQQPQYCQAHGNRPADGENRAWADQIGRPAGDAKAKGQQHE